MTPGSCATWLTNACGRDVNAERAAEEARGVARWLCSQHVGATVQGTLAHVDERKTQLGTR